MMLSLGGSISPMDTSTLVSGSTVCISSTRPATLWALPFWKQPWLTNSEATRLPLHRIAQELDTNHLECKVCCPVIKQIVCAYIVLVCFQFNWKCKEGEGIPPWNSGWQGCQNVLSGGDSSGKHFESEGPFLTYIAYRSWKHPPPIPLKKACPC